MQNAVVITDGLDFKFWIRLQELPEKSIAKQCLQLSKEMAENIQVGLAQQVKTVCDNFNFNEIAFLSHIKQCIRNALIEYRNKYQESLFLRHD